MADLPHIHAVKPDEKDHEDAFGLLFGPDYGGTYAPMNYQQHEQYEDINVPKQSNGNGNGNGGIQHIDEHNFLGLHGERIVENDIGNERGNDVMWVVDKISKQDDQFEENLMPGESNGKTEENNYLSEVRPGDCGEGLPYAPIDWPCPGDVWSWRVGKRASGGYYNDRFISLPKRLHKIGKRSFGSKTSLGKYIHSEFPGADVNAFFATFTWKIPAKSAPAKQVEAVALSLEGPPEDKTAEVVEEVYSSGRRKRKLSSPAPRYSETFQEKKEKTPRSTLKKERNLSSSKKSRQDVADSSSKPKRTSLSTSNRKSRQSFASVTDNEGGIVEDQLAEIPEDFDNYLNSLEDILTKPLFEDAISLPASTDKYIEDGQMAKARSKLSSLLQMDFPSLVLSRNNSKLATLASQLRKDPTLNAEQLVKLKLIEEIPLFSEVFLESREMIEEVDKCFSALEANKTKVSSLKSEYTELKEKADQLQAQVDSSSLTVKEIDDQVSQLLAWRAELTSAIENNKVAKDEINSAQKVVASAIPGVVRDIQVANSRIPEWELKRINAMKRETEILEKFGPLHGFSL